MLQAMCLIGGVPQDGLITSVSANRTGTGVELIVRGEGLQKPRALPFLNGRMSVLEFNAGMDATELKKTVGYGGMQSYNAFWHSMTPPVIRVNVRLDQPSTPQFTEMPNGWKVSYKAIPGQPKLLASTAKEGLAEADKDLESLDTYSPATPTAQDRVTIDFVNTDIVQILKSLALQSGVNIVTSPDVKNTLTVKLVNVTIDEALRLVTSLAGLSYARVGSAYVVAASDKIEQIKRQITGQQEPVPVRPDTMTRTYQVQGGSAKALLEAVGAQQGMSITATPETSTSQQTIVMTGPAPQVEEFHQLLQTLDGSLGAGDVFFYDVKFLDPRSLREDVVTVVPGLRATIAPGSALNFSTYTQNDQFRQANQTAGNTGESETAAGAAGGGGGGGGGAAGGGATGGGTNLGGAGAGPGYYLPYRGDGTYNTQESQSVPMRLVLRGSPSQLAAAREYLSKIDIEPKQIAVEMRVMELSKEDALRVGLNWDLLTKGGLLGITSPVGGAGTILDASIPMKGGTSFDFVSSALDKLQNDQNLIARPNLLAVEGRQTEVFIGDVIPYIKSITQGQGGEVNIQTAEVTAGVRLTILPRIGSNGDIMMDLRPVVSNLVGFIDAPGGGQLPRTSVRMTQSSAVLKSGETLALGGLIKDEDRRLEGGVPILKDIPIIGQLFRRTNKSRLRTEIVFFLTAKVVDSSNRQNAAQPVPDPGQAIKKG